MVVVVVVVAAGLPGKTLCFVSVCFFSFARLLYTRQKQIRQFFPTIWGKLSVSFLSVFCSSSLRQSRLFSHSVGENSPFCVCIFFCLLFLFVARLPYTRQTQTRLFCSHSMGNTVCFVCVCFCCFLLVCLMPDHIVFIIVWGKQTVLFLWLVFLIPDRHRSDFFPIALGDAFCFASISFLCLSSHPYTRQTQTRQFSHNLGETICFVSVCFLFFARLSYTRPDCFAQSMGKIICLVSVSFSVLCSSSLYQTDTDQAVFP